MLGNRYPSMERNPLPDFVPGLNLTGEKSSSSGFNLICLGGLSVDLILRAPRLPRLDEKLVVQYAGKQAGGLVANAACAAARLGLKVAWVGTLGEDDFGRLAMEAFTQFGVDADLATVDPSIPTDFTVILLDPGGDRTILVVPTSPSPPALGPAVMEALAHTHMVYTIPQSPAWFKSVADAVHAGDGLVAVDIEGSSPLQGEDLQTVLKCTDIVFCNRRGLLLTAGDTTRASPPGNEAKAIQNSAQRLLQMGVRVVCVTLGKEGALAVCAGYTTHAPGYSVPVIDTTGAGDCFHAAYLYAHFNHYPLPKALQFANAAAALSVGRLGARGGLPTAQQVTRFLAEAGTPN
jgi:sugar/nucleoside kinase (ribokinase family)